MREKKGGGGKGRNFNVGVIPKGRGRDTDEGNDPVGKEHIQLACMSNWECNDMETRKRHFVLLD